MDEFIISDNFVKNSTRVALNGLWLRCGASFDYVEDGDNKIVLKESVLVGDSLVVEYTGQ